MRYGYLAVAAAGLLFFQNGAAAEPEPVDYVRICDAYGSGFFYIPGTETCLRLRGGYQRSRLENTHELGSGTVVRGGGSGNEIFLSSFSDWFERDGLSFRTEIRPTRPEHKFAGFPVIAGYVEYQGAWADAGYEGTTEVGVGGVTGVGLTFYQPDAMYGTGFFAGSAGFGLDGEGFYSGSWNAFNGGVEIDLTGVTGTASEDSPVRITGILGAYYEDLYADANGHTDLTFNGLPYNGYYQDYSLDTQDRYYGVRAGLQVEWKPTIDANLKFTFGADAYLAYHEGSGDFSQTTGAPGVQIVQGESYSHDGFTVSPAFRFGSEYALPCGFQIGTEFVYSLLPDVTSFRAPQNPLEQADAGFSSEWAQRMFFGLNLTKSF